MTPSSRQEKLQAWKRMNESLTQAARIYRRFTQGVKVPKKLPDPVKAMMLIREARAKLEAALMESKPPLDPSDCAIAIVYACPSGDPDALQAQMIRVRFHNETEVLTAMLECKAIVVGMVFALRDRERPRRWMWAQPFSMEPSALELLNQALDKQEQESFVS